MAALCVCPCLRSVAAQALISFLLIGVENIGIQIEEPFAILPLSAYCTAIQRDVREVVARGEGAALRRHTSGTLTRSLCCSSLVRDTRRRDSSACGAQAHVTPTTDAGGHKLVARARSQPPVYPVPAQPPPLGNAVDVVTIRTA